MLEKLSEEEHREFKVFKDKYPSDHNLMETCLKFYLEYRNKNDTLLKPAPNDSNLRDRI